MRSDMLRARRNPRVMHKEGQRWLQLLPALPCTNLHLWWVRRVRFWNTLACQPDTSFHKLVTLSDCMDAVSHDVRNWAYAFMRGLRDFGCSFTIPADAMEVVNLGRVRQLLHVRAA